MQALLSIHKHCGSASRADPGASAFTGQIRLPAGKTLALIQTQRNSARGNREQNVPIGEDVGGPSRHSSVEKKMNDRQTRILASAGLATGGLLGMAGAFAPSAGLRGLAWGIDGVALVMTSAVLAVHFFRQGQDLVASGFLVFMAGEGVVLSGAAMDLAASVPSFGAGAGLWSAALALISIRPVFPLPARVLGLAACVLFALTALRIFAGTPLLPTTAPLPFYAYPVFVATLFSWIWALLKDG
jgi:hypothetical protein